jgi:hypothetical protein
MLKDFFLREADTDVDPQGGASGKTRASDVLDQYGRDGIKIAEKLAEVLTDNSQLREQRRSLREEVTTLKAKVAPDGARVLTAEEAKAYDAYAALGKPEDVKKALEANSEATAKLAKLEKAERLRAAAEAAGYKPSVLERLASDLTIEVRPVKDSAPLVVVVADGQETALADYAKQNWGDFLPALEAKNGAALAPDINAGARGNGQTPLITDDDRRRADAHYRHTF